MSETKAPSAQHILFPITETHRDRETVSRTAWRRNLPLGAPTPAANDNDADLVSFSRARPKHSFTIEALLEWAYRRQRAHQILRTEMDWVLWAMDRAGYIANPSDCRKLHYDAALVHEQVLALGAEVAAMVIAASMFGDWPQWIDETTPRPRPAEPRDPLDDYGYHKADDGSRARHLKRLVEIVSVEREEYEPAGRKKMKRADPTLEKVPVVCCVVEWSPEPEFIEANNRLVVLWETTRPVLMQALREAPFKDHILADDTPGIIPLAVSANDNEVPIANDNEPDLAAALG